MGYWQTRQNVEYYQVVKLWLEELSPLDSVLDVGCFDTPVATWGQFTDRYTIDLRPRPALIGVRQIIGEWPGCSSLVPVCDVVTCLQVLEHLPHPRSFCEALLSRSRKVVIVSVPWMWQAGSCPGHIHDPVGEAKLLFWMGVAPTRFEIVGKPTRAVGYYEIGGGNG